jgi:hypothetical protein
MNEEAKAKARLLTRLPNLSEYYMITSVERCSRRERGVRVRVVLDICDIGGGGGYNLIIYSVN